MKEIKKITALYDEIKETNTQIVLATVFRISGSSYRRTGARMLILGNGRWVGGISGGCLEGDVMKKAKKTILTGKACIIEYDNREDDPYQIGVGLGCKGKIEILLQRIDANKSDNPIEYLRQIADSKYYEVMTTILKSDHPNLLVGQQITDSESYHIDFREAKEACLESKSSAVRTFSVGGKQLTVFLEVLKPAIHLTIVGDNYDIYSLIDAANLLDWKITIVGKLRKLRKSAANTAIEYIDVEKTDFSLLKTKSERAALVLLTHDFNTDLKVLNELAVGLFAYVGVLGPRKRLIEIEQQIDNQTLFDNGVHGPIGLDIGAETPEEIAVAITSEIIAFFSDRPGTSLHLRQQSIYERTVLKI